MQGVLADPLPQGELIDYRASRKISS